MNAPANTDPTISASAIESYDPELEGCPRLWAWVRIDGLEKPQHPSAGLGDGVHKAHEAYLLDGMPYDLSTLEGRIAHTTMHLLPNPGQAEVEKAFKFKWEGITWGGRKDFRYWDSPAIDTTGKAELLIVVNGDHKTTSNFQYAKNTREKLLGHPQAPLYALSEFVAPGIITPDIVRLEWNYAKTGIQWETDDDGNFLLDPAGNYRYKVRSRPVALDPPVRELVTRPEAETAMRKFLPVARAMVDTLNNGCKTALELAPNPDVCNARKFGKKGCPFKSRCNLSAEVIAQAAFAKLVPTGTETERTMDPLEAFLAKNRPVEQHTVTPNHTVVGPVIPMTPERQLVTELNKPLESGQIPAHVAATVIANQAIGSQQAAIAAAGELFKQAANPPAINPPEQFTAAQTEPPTQPETPQARQGQARRGRPPGSSNKAVLAESDAWDRIAAALEKIAEALSGKAA